MNQGELILFKDDLHDAPTSGNVKLYIKADGSLYRKDEANNEFKIPDADNVDFLAYDYTPSGDQPFQETGTTTNATHNVDWDVSSVLGAGYNGYALIGGSFTNNSTSTASLIVYDETVPPTTGAGQFLRLEPVPASTVVFFGQAIVPIISSIIHFQLVATVGVSMDWDLRLLAAKRNAV